MKLVLIAFFLVAISVGFAQNGSAPANATPSSSTQEQTISEPTVSKPKPPTRVRISQMTSEKMLLKKVQPNYPREARRNGIQGVVVMKGVIAIDGSIKELKLVSGHPLLADCAMDAVRQWRYKPYILKAEPVEVETLITVNYELRP